MGRLLRGRAPLVWVALDEGWNASMVLVVVLGVFGSEFGIHCLLEWTDVLCRSLLAGRRERLTSRGREGNRFCNLRWGVVVVVAFTFHLLLITELLTFATVKGIRRL
jgi:hypothetical protein